LDDGDDMIMISIIMNIMMKMTMTMMMMMIMTTGSLRGKRRKRPCRQVNDNNFIISSTKVAIPE